MLVQYLLPHKTFEGWTSGEEFGVIRGLCKDYQWMILCCVKITIFCTQLFFLNIFQFQKKTLDRIWKVSTAEEAKYFANGNCWEKTKAPKFCGHILYTVFSENMKILLWLYVSRVTCLRVLYDMLTGPGTFCPATYCPRTYFKWSQWHTVLTVKLRTLPWAEWKYRIPIRWIPGCDTLTMSISAPPQTFHASAGRVHQVAGQPGHHRGQLDSG